MKDIDTEGNKAVVQRYVDEIQNQHNLDAIESIFSGQFVDHMATYGGMFQGLDGLKRGYAELLFAFPDLTATVNDMIAEDDKVVVYKTVRGTHQGEYQGIPATGKKVEFQSIYIFRIENNRISDYWGMFDEFGLKRQLGVLSESSG